MKRIISILAMVSMAVVMWAAEPTDSVSAEPEYVPSDYQPGDWSVGFNAGVGGLFSAGDISNGFSNAFTFNAGLKVGYRRLSVEGMLLYGSPSIDNPNVTGAVNALGVPYHNNVNSANLLGVGANIGYTIVDFDKFGVTPWAGAMWTSYRWTARPMEEDADGVLIQKGEQCNMSIDDFNLAFGVNFEWHFARTDTYVALFGSDGQVYRSSLRLTPYVVKGSYSDAVPQLDGWHIGVSLCYTGVLRTLGLRY